MKKTIPAVAVVALVLGIFAGRPAMAERVEEPEYTVVKKAGDVELRRYEPTIRAVTLVENVAWDQAMNEGFRRLAGYIFGGNTRRQSIAMTAPVTAQPAAATGRGGEKIAMTAPVTSAPDGGGIRVTFTMPAGSTLDTLPVPARRDVVLEPVPERLVAVRRFSGFAGDKKFARERRALVDALPELGVHPVGEPELARYDPPWTLPFLRRNEVAVEVAP